MTPELLPTVFTKTLARLIVEPTEPTQSLKAMDPKEPLSTPPFSSITPYEQRKISAQLENNTTEKSANPPSSSLIKEKRLKDEPRPLPEPEITFNLMIVSSALYTMSLGLAHTIFPVWARSISHDAVDEIGIGLNIRFQDVESVPFCFFLHNIYRYLPDYQHLANSFNKPHFQTSLGKRMVLRVKTLALPRRFQIDVPGVEVVLVAEIEELLDAFVKGRGEWKEG